MKNFVDELKWRGMIHDVTPSTSKFLEKNKTSGYIGFDPTADSLHIGNLVQIMTLVHFQNFGHKPIILIGGATGMIGDPSGKSKERKFLDEKTLINNQNKIQSQFEKFLDFDGEKSASILNNKTWFENFNLLSFLREVGKHISVNYMMAKDSVKNRLETGISFTEFSYQLIQGYDFYWLWKNKNVKIQFGGSDQWGNILTGNELIRRIEGGESFALTTPLITKSDGGKFGKTEDGNVWLDEKRTSPYKFYQFWINVSDEDAAKFIKIFTLKEEEEIKNLIISHEKEPHLRILQNALADEITERVHDKQKLDIAKSTSLILFGKSKKDDFDDLKEDVMQSLSTAVPCVKIKKEDINSDFKNLLTEITSFEIFSSKSELIRLIKNNGLSINKEKISNDEYDISKNLKFKKYLLIQKGKKNYTFIIVE
ncbi:MAG: tyrosine--tRNA ligase [Cytophagales bacterium]|nr:MAG: tyrosine--tRNA ligase [Rhodothermaeota bacterium MED-G16]|tara:strand:+ start:1248 stop:2522 length:1275 start_codon:yes stop_codon:yes gene_type:complete